MTKYIEKPIEDENTGADVKYHEITAYSVDLQNNYSTVTVASYISRKMKELGKSPVGTPIMLSLNAAPAMNENPIDWFYNELIKPISEDFVPPTETYVGYVNPYSFSGGKVKEITG